MPKLVEVAEPVRIGGRYDKVARRFVGPCSSYRVWLVGERQVEVLLRRDPEKSRTLLYSAEGAGKTVLAAQWAILQVLFLATAGERGAIGATAPTTSRLGSLRTAITDLIPVDLAREGAPGSWATLYTDASEIRFVTGHTLQLRATQRASAAAGSPIQGYTWKACVVDEMQDQVEQGVYPDIEARLRGAETSYIMATATAKDSPGWRNWRDSLSKHWQIERISYRDTPFVHDEHWARMRQNISAREWMRRGEAADIGPECMVYTSWDRAENIRPIPLVGAKDVTARVLARYAPNRHMLLGHDPGSLQDVTLMLKAYQLPGEDDFSWWVVDELRTKQTTAEEHAIALLERLRSRHGIQYPDADEPKCLVRCDPYGENDQRPDKSVYLTFQRHGFDIRSAAYKNGKGSGRVPKEAGIEMVNGLLCSAAGKRRLFIAADETGAPMAPGLVEALELSERDSDGKAETQKKSKKGPGGDLSDFPAALRYSLWSIERVRSTYATTAGSAVG